MFGEGEKNGLQSSKTLVGTNWRFRNLWNHALDFNIRVQRT
jgi:hypothetical protein